MPDHLSQPEPAVVTVHECDWCLEERTCERARAGTGHLWICADCAADRLTEAAQSGTQCGACRGDGSIPDAVCTLPAGHEGAHYG